MKDPRSKGYAWVIPCFTVKDPLKSQDFYEKAFGFDKGYTLPGPDGKVVHADMRYKGQVIMMFGPENMPGCAAKSPATTHTSMPNSVYVYVDDVDALYLRAVKAGAEALQPPADMFWGDRVTTLKDINGYQWMFATNIRQMEEVTFPKEGCK